MNYADVSGLRMLREQWDRLIESANALMAKEQFAQAESAMREALALQETTLGQDHPAVSATLNNYAALCVAMDDFERATALAERSLAICRQALGEEHPHVARLARNCQALSAMRPKSRRTAGAH